jgi:hypothetical protein
MTESGYSSEPGPLAEEAARLFAAAQEWFHRTLGDGAGARIATGAPECAWCPVCQLIRALRNEGPELAERFNEFQTAVAGLLHTLADAAAAASSSATKPGGRSDSRVERIDLNGGR